MLQREAAVPGRSTCIGHDFVRERFDKSLSINRALPPILNLRPETMNDARSGIDDLIAREAIVGVNIWAVFALPNYG